MGDESSSTVLVAAAANLCLAAAKLVAGLASGSGAMLSEAAHSVGDTVNEAFLLVAIRRGSRPADRLHPFGYGMEQYFWSLLAAVGVFVLGAGFATYQGISTLLQDSTSGPAFWAFVVLGLAFAFEGTSLARAQWQLRREARDAGVGMRAHLQGEADPALRAVVLEDTAALLGLFLAATGLTLSELTGSTVPDGIASLLIATLLVGVAFELGRRNQHYLIGMAASRPTILGIERRIAESDGIDDVLEVLTMRLAPDQLLVAARVDLADDLSPEQLEHAADEVERTVREEFPEVRHLFLDPTPKAGE
jgi:cation diffusion facilitator family transporter